MDVQTDTQTDTQTYVLVEPIFLKIIFFDFDGIFWSLANITFCINSGLKWK